MYRNPIIITQPDLLRLADLLRRCLPTWPYLAALERQLRDATVVSPAHVPPDVVTMGSRFAFTDRRTGVSETYRLVYPDEADLDRGRLSVFAPIGTAVLGRRTGQTVWWNVPSGLRVVRIDDVPFQPEARARNAADDTDATDDDTDPPTAPRRSSSAAAVAPSQSRPTPQR
jgi:regulator of nucleoside diphosphate kinase